MSGSGSRLSQEFAVRLRALRARALLSQEDLAGRAGISSRTVRYLEGGRVQPRGATVRLLVAALGLSGSEARSLEEAAAGAGTTGDPRASAPAQLPPDVPDFLGRDKELSRLARLLERAGASGPQRPAVLITSLAGAAGVGKTALAVHWAHALASLFPDGHLFVDLRGFSVEGPLDPADALARFLRALGVPPAAVPYDTDERAALFRTTIADRQMILVLDNASSADQVRPLLPGSPGCLVLVTSRDSLMGLAARDGARRLVIEQMAPPDARRLLTQIVGPRALQEPDAVARLVELCDRLPLALRVAAELVAERPDSALLDLVSELGDQQRRLDLLDTGGDESTSVTAVFSWSYRRLSPYAAQAFRALGPHPGPDVDVGAVAAMADLPVPSAEAALRELARGHLVAATAVGRYWLHDLLHAYAARLVADEGGPDERHRMSERLGAHYLAGAARAVDVLLPATAPLRPKPPAPPPSVPALDEESDALVWLDAERPVLANPGLEVPPQVSIGLSLVLSRYLYEGSYNVEARVIHTRAQQAAEAKHDIAGQAGAIRGLCTVYWRWGRLAAAAELADRAVALARAAHAPLIEALAVGDKGGISGQQARYDEAETAFERALHLYRRYAVPYGEASTLLNLGVVYERRGQFDEAVRHYRRAENMFARIGYLQGQAGAVSNLAEVARQRGEDSAASEYARAADLFHRMRNPVQEARALDGLGAAFLRLGRISDAVEVRERALEMFRSAGNRFGEGWAHDGLAACLVAQDRFEEALDGYRRALDIFAETGDRTGAISSLNGSGEALLGLQQHTVAADRLQEALIRARATGDRLEQGRALVGLGRVAQIQRDEGAARAHWTEAHVIFTALGVPEREEVSQMLAHLAEQ